jgi:hypothetical protein
MPTRAYALGTDTLSGSNIAAHSSFCKDFNNGKAGAVGADVTPPSIHLVLSSGTCSAPNQMLAENDREVANVNAPAGWNHVKASNSSDSDTAFTLRITYWH